jgi:hypothetical protein
MPPKTPHLSSCQILPIAQPRRFRIELRGPLDPGWLSAFTMLSFSSSEQLTTLEVFADQATLRGIVNRLWDLNLDLRSIVEVAGPATQNGGYRNG